ncbi:MAG: class I SAM-dependent methyltransferase [Actinomycetota bacterium]|nr:class I SAM-dependent methyltransferase [Actinomycetota bacterium]
MTQELNEAKTEEFAGKMVGVVNDAMLALMTSIGHRTKLFDAMADLPPSTSEEIAAAANLDERYVREWLGAMTVGGIVEHDADAKTYHLPPEHAACLTRAAGPDNLAGLAQFVSLLGNVEGGIVESFRDGGGVPYSEYARFQELMAEDSAQVYGATLIETTLPLIPGMVERLKSGADALDVGCGAGVAVNLMARAFPNSRFTGYDLSEEGIAAAKAEGLPNARFEVKDARSLGESGAYDLITAFDVIHDLAHPADVLASIHDALRPGGTFLMVDVAASSHLHENTEHPLGPFLYTVSTMHCMTVSLEQGGDGLGAVWGEQKAREMLAEAGFEHVEVKQVEGDILNNYYIARKD